MRTTIYLTDELKAALEARSRAEGRSESDIIREALAEKLRMSKKPTRDMKFGEYDSGSTDTSENVDQILAETGFGIG